MSDRLRAWQALFDRVEERRATSDGIALRFPLEPEVLGALATVAAQEVGCCSFFVFTLTIDARTAWLAVAAPSDAVPLVRELFGPVDA